MEHLCKLLKVALDAAKLLSRTLLLHREDSSEEESRGSLARKGAAMFSSCYCYRWRDLPFRVQIVCVLELGISVAILLERREDLRLSTQGLTGA